MRFSTVLFKQTKPTETLYIPGLRNEKGEIVVIVTLPMKIERAQKVADDLLEQYTNGKGYLQRVGVL